MVIGFARFSDTTCSDSSTNWVAIGVGCAGGAILAPFVVSALGFTAAGIQIVIIICLFYDF